MNAAVRRHRPNRPTLCLLAISAVVLTQGVHAKIPWDHDLIDTYVDSSSCMECHEEERRTEIMETIHWTWDHTDSITGQKLGKKRVINNFCVAVPSNEARCTSCHIGVGWTDMRAEFNDPDKIDCLVCHDSTGTYEKTPKGAGAPDPSLDLTHIAQWAGTTTRQTCGSCHFYGGGGNAVKHGDLDSTMTNPSRSLDVHMGTDGGNFTCAECHVDPDSENKHELIGTVYSTDTPDHMLCQKCHVDSSDPANPVYPHENERLNAHSLRVSCQTCHIPEFARGGQATKMTWDWTTAGDRLPDGSDRVIKDADGNPTYHSKKGTFTWQKDVVPEYRWFNGQVTFASLDDTVVPGEVVSMNQLHGDKDDPNARLFPVKRFTGRQFYDAGAGRLALPHLFPKGPTDTAAYWKGYDWEASLRYAMEYVGDTFTGPVGVADTEMFWIQNHMVAPKEQALDCSDCHSPGSRINFLELGYEAEKAARLQAGIPPEHEFIDLYADSSTCMECHEEERRTEIMETIHWTWDHTDSITGQQLGKKHVINNFCVAVPSNEARCTSCHIGVGWTDMREEFNDPDKIDCLVCHDTTGTYKKVPTGAGAPDSSLDLTEIANWAGKTSRKTCGSCHFFGGGGNAVKHGDLDSTMTDPPRSLDVHMGIDGGNFTCAECHVDPESENKHEMIGTVYSTDTPDHMLCEKCHVDRSDPANPVYPHDDEALNTHSGRVACQACHIPEFARGGQATKMTWDWTTAGDRLPDGKDRVIRDADGNPTYHSKKGTFTWEKDVVPEYRWFNGQVTFATLDDTVMPGEVMTINRLHGDKDDPNARLFPVKRFTGRQPYDAGANRLSIPHLFPKGPTDLEAYWKGYDWEASLTFGMEYIGDTFTGPVGAVDTEMFWIQNHMVAPKEQALDCSDCHSANDRVDFLQLGYEAEKAARLQTLYAPDAVTVNTTATGYDLGWTATPGHDYQVQSSPDLKNWTNEPGGAFSATGEPGETCTFPCPVNGERKMFFRVIRTRP